MSGLQCDVCNSDKSVGVASSTLGAVSFAYCAECNTRNAEPLGVLVGMLCECNGDVADWVKKLTSWYEGEYIGFAVMLKFAELDSANTEIMNLKEDLAQIGMLASVSAPGQDALDDIEQACEEALE